MSKITKKDLKQYRSLLTCKDIEAEELDRMQPEHVADTYKDYRSGYPVVKVVHGVEDRDYFAMRKWKKVRKIERIVDRVSRIEEFVQGVNDLEMQNILRLVFIQGYSQKQAAKKLGKGWTREAVAKRIERFFSEK